MRWMESESEGKSRSLPQPVSLFITIMSVLLSPYQPTKISYSQGVCSNRVLAEWRVGPSIHFGQKGLEGGVITLLTLCRTVGKGRAGMLRTAGGSAQCHLGRQKIQRQCLYMAGFTMRGTH